MSSETNKDNTKVRCHSGSLGESFQQPLQPCSHYLGKDHLPLCPGWLNSLPDSQPRPLAVFPPPSCHCSLSQMKSREAELLPKPSHASLCLTENPQVLLNDFSIPASTSQLFCLHCFSYTCSPSLLQTHPWSCSSLGLAEAVFFFLESACPGQPHRTIYILFFALVGLTTSS